MDGHNSLHPGMHSSLHDAPSLSLLGRRLGRGQLFHGSHGAALKLASRRQQHEQKYPSVFTATVIIEARPQHSLELVGMSALSSAQVWGEQFGH